MVAAALTEALYRGAPCRHGHDGTRYKRTNECLYCKRDHHRRWKKSAVGKKYGREWAQKKYVAHPLPRKPPKTTEEKKALNKKYYQNYKPKARIRWDDHMMRLRRYGMSREEYLELAASQHNKCAICFRSQENLKRRHLCVDHDHKTGKIRGLLCDNCNKGIGCLQDNPSVVMRALLYLRRTS